MARFFFHLVTPDSIERDEVGSEHRDANQAYLEGFETAQQMTVDLIRQHRNPARHRFEICDEQDRVVFHLPFTEIVGHAAGPHEMLGNAARNHGLISDVNKQILNARAELGSIWETLKSI